MAKGAEECPKCWKAFVERYGLGVMDPAHPQNAEQQALVDNGIGEFALCDCDMQAGTFLYFISGKYRGGFVPEGMEIRKVPYTQWLRFTFEGGMAAFHRNYMSVYQEWLPQHPEYKPVMPVNVEWYSPGDMNASDYRCGVMVPIL